MIDILLCYRRRQDIGRSRFRAYWRSERKALVRVLQAKLGFPDYVQLRRSSRINPLYAGMRLSRSWPVAALVSLMRGTGLPSPFPKRGGAHERWDVVETLSYPSLDEAVAALSSPEGQTALARLRDDLEALVGNGAAIVADRQPVRADETLGHPRTVTLFFLRARPPMTAGKMLEYWGGPHRVLVESLTSAMGHRVYDQLHAIDADAPAAAIEPFGGEQSHPYAGVARLCYASQWTLIRRLIDPRLHIANTRLVWDEAGFIDLGASALVFGQEESL